MTTNLEVNSCQSDILGSIIDAKRREVAERIELLPTKMLERSIHFSAPTVSLKHYLHREDQFGIIAEIKRRSPSRGVINNFVSVEALAVGYMQAGASALSVLTDSKFFGGSSEDLTIARRFNFCPILRKDFIIDEYQIVEARSIGADAILLIAACLTPEQVRQYAKFAKSFGLEVLLEIHQESELSHICDQVDVVGINNRDLRDFSVDVQRSFILGAKIPSSMTKISESGVSQPSTIRDLRAVGFRGFLIGEAFMSHPKPEIACKKMIDAIKGEI